MAQNEKIVAGAGLAILATFIWSGNFIVARGVYQQIHPVSLAFLRWATATVVLLPFALRKFLNEWLVVKRSWRTLLWTAITGISLFNTFVYIAGHYTSAINLALIGTTSSPVMSLILARIFLGERIGLMKIIGTILCIGGILFLLSNGSFQKLMTLNFSEGDIWMLIAALCFAIYNIMVRKKPAALSPLNFLFTTFLIGSVLLLPFFIWTFHHGESIIWSRGLIFSILYLGIGASVVCFFIWNRSISILGAGRTALFGNLIPVFSTLEAVLILGEKFTPVHLVSMVIVCAGLIVANLQPRKIRYNLNPKSNP